MKHSLLAAAAGIALLAAPAAAAPLAITKDVSTAVAAESNVEKVHGWHRSCQLGVRGWHFHDRYSGRVPCRPFVRRRYY